MLNFNAKMHQIWCWLVLCPRLHWGSIQCSADNETI